jgi:hypothetical protein
MTKNGTADFEDGGKDPGYSTSVQHADHTGTLS